MDYLANIDEIIGILSKNFQMGIFDEVYKYSKGESFMLLYISKKKRPVLTREMSMSLHMSIPRVWKILNKLEDTGMIVRELDKKDRRKTRVHITEIGLNRVFKEKNELSNKMKTIIQRMNKKDLDELVCLLQKFLDCSTGYAS